MPVLAAVRLVETLPAVDSRALLLLDPELVGQLPSLWNDVTKIVDTNLNVNDVAYLATFGLQLDDSRIKQRSIDRAALENFTTATGAQVLLIVPERVQLVVEEAFTPPLSNVASQAAAQVEGVNGNYLALHPSVGELFGKEVLFFVSNMEGGHGQDPYWQTLLRNLEA